MKIKNLTEKSTEEIKLSPTDENITLMNKAKEKLKLIKKEPWRLKYLNKWFQLQISQKRTEFEISHIRDAC